jgi:hypothetical protein
VHRAAGLPVGLWALTALKKLDLRRCEGLTPTFMMRRIQLTSPRYQPGAEQMHRRLIRQGGVGGGVGGAAAGGQEDKKMVVMVAWGGTLWMSCGRRASGASSSCCACDITRTSRVHYGTRASDSSCCACDITRTSRVHYGTRASDLWAAILTPQMLRRKRKLGPQALDFGL